MSDAVLVELGEGLLARDAVAEFAAGLLIRDPMAELADCLLTSNALVELAAGLLVRDAPAEPAAVLLARDPLVGLAAGFVEPATGFVAEALSIPPAAFAPPSSAALSGLFAGADPTSRVIAPLAAPAPLSAPVTALEPLP